jgi:integral membrane protein
MHSINAIKWLRHTGIAEGISSLLLFFVAMPLKYLTDKPEAVRVVGMIHGILFTLYVLALVRAAFVLQRSWGWSAKIFIAAIIPFGPFMVEPGLRREQEAQCKAPAE